MNKYITEFIGTFFLVLTVGCSVIIGGPGVFAPLAIGSALMIMVYAGGHISGGHYNPAVTLGVWVRGRCPTKDLAPYWVAQIIGGVVAAIVVDYLKSGVETKPMVLKIGPALLSEFLYTFALVYVVINTATAKGNAGNSFYGLAIGFTVLVGAFAVGTISSAAFNPAVAVGISIMGLSSWSNIWICFVANLLGGAAAGFTFIALNPGGQISSLAPPAILRRISLEPEVNKTLSTFPLVDSGGGTIFRTHEGKNAPNPNVSSGQDLLQKSLGLQSSLCGLTRG